MKATKIEFEKKYMSNSGGLSESEYAKLFVTLPCECGASDCNEWAAVSNNEESIKAHISLYSKSEKINSIDSYVHNCLLLMRKQDKSIFHNVCGVALASLNGYAVIPLADYQKLTGEDFSNEIARSMDFDENKKLVK